MSFERVARLSVRGGRAEPGTNPKSQALPFCGKIRLPEETNMRKLIVLSAAALLAGALAGGVHATPLSATGAMAMSGVTMGGAAAITTAGAITIRPGTRITGVPEISRISSA